MVARNPSPHLIILVNCYTITHYLGQKSVITFSRWGVISLSEWICMVGISTKNTLQMELQNSNTNASLVRAPSDITLGAIKLPFYLLVIWISIWRVISPPESICAAFISVKYLLHRELQCFNAHPHEVREPSSVAVGAVKLVLYPVSIWIPSMVVISPKESTCGHDFYIAHVNIPYNWSFNASNAIDPAARAPSKLVLRCIKLAFHPFI